jgi:hypothetical protein
MRGTGEPIMAEKEYIERGALIAEMDSDAPENWTNSDTEIQEEWDYHRYRDMILAQPAADVVEVVHARWEKTHDDPRVNKYRCTNCKAEKMRDNYCPNCGAKMDGATDNNVGDKVKEMTGEDNGN